MAFLAIVASGMVLGGAQALAQKRVVAYYTAWSTYVRDYQVADIPANKLTHINYAFANLSGGQVVLGDTYADTQKFFPGDDWSDPAGTLRGNFNQLQHLKAQNPDVKMMLSVGGWTWSGQFSNAALTEQSRQKFAQSGVAFIRQYGFDGLDIDWEYPVSGGLGGNVTRPADRHNYTLLLKEMREQLDVAEAEDRRKYELTIAAPAGPAIYANYELDKIHPYLDAINVMAYDFHGGWENATNFNAPLVPTSDDPSTNPVVRDQFNYTSALQAYVDAGVPKEKIIAGVPFYGRGWSGVPNVDNGLYQSAGGLPQGSWEVGVFDYKDLMQNYLGNGYVRYWHDEAKAPWLYNPNTGIMISYDDPESLKAKMDVIDALGLGGAMVWELSSDDSNDSLLNVLNDRLLTQLTGDYNDDGVVDAADYSVWRDNLGASVTLSNDTTPGSVTAADYQIWKANLGYTSATSTHLTQATEENAVPEPSTLVMLLVGGMVLAGKTYCRLAS